MDAKPRKVLMKLTDEQWNTLRSRAVGRFGWTAGTLVESLVLDWLGRAEEGGGAAPPPVAGQLVIEDAPARRRATRAAATTKKESTPRRRTRK